LNKVIDLRTFTNSVSVPTLVLVDLQEEYVAAGRALAIPDATVALANCRSALRHARARGFPVAYSRWIGHAPYFNPATRFSRWIEGFEPSASDLIFERSLPSCYANEHFAEVMTSGGGNFVLAGFAGEVACLATAIEAFHRGHRVTFLADASASHPLESTAAKDVHKFVADLVALWAGVTETESWIISSAGPARTRNHQHA
jgi:nicotinamidase-related amidase